MHLSHLSKIGLAMALMIFIALPMASAQEIYGEIPGLTVISNTDRCGGDVPCETVYQICGDDKIKESDIKALFKDKKNRDKTDKIKNKDIVLVDVVNNETNCKQFTVTGEKSAFSDIDNIPCVYDVCDSRYIWWNGTWLSRKAVTIVNTNTTAAIPAGQVVEFVIDTTGADFQDDGDDIRLMFTDDSEATWIEIPIINWASFNSVSSRLFFKLNSSIPASASSDSQYYIYYNNALAPDPGYNGHQVFGFLWDDFDDNVNGTVWTTGNCDWNIAEYVHCDYDLGVSDRDLRTSAIIGNFSVMLARWSMEDITGTGYGPRWTFTSTTGACSEPRASGVENDLVSFLPTTVYDAFYDFSISTTWYDAKIVRGGGSVNNEIWIDWVKIVDNSTTLCKQDGPTTAGWIMGEDADHNLNIDTFAVYDYFYPVPNITVESEETVPVTPTNITESCPTDIIAMCEPFDVWDSAVCLDNSTLERIKSCSIDWVDSDINYTCNYVKTEETNCNNGCFDDLTAIGSGCAPTDMEILGATAVIFVIFIAGSTFVMRNKRRRR